MNTSPTTEDRIWAALSHLASLAFGMGIALPIIGWSDRRQKSNYGSFQNLQALGYQSLGFTVWILSYLVLIIIVSIVLLALLGPEGSRNESSNEVLTPWMIGFSIVMFGMLALYFILPVIAAIACALGKDFRYPILGNRLARYLGYSPMQNSDEPIGLIEDHEFRWVAAMGHFSILIIIWGMLAPLIAWTLRGKQNLFLKFQSVQTLVYQAGTTILYFVGVSLYMGGLFALIASMGGLGNMQVLSAPEIGSIFVFGGLLLCGGVIILVIPLLHILGQWAGYRVLKGDNYHYPLIGRWVEKWLSKKSVSEEKPA